MPTHLVHGWAWTWRTTNGTRSPDSNMSEHLRQNGTCRRLRYLYILMIRPVPENGPISNRWLYTWRTKDSDLTKSAMVNGPSCSWMKRRWIAFNAHHAADTRYTGVFAVLLFATLGTNCSITLRHCLCAKAWTDTNALPCGSMTAHQSSSRWTFHWWCSIASLRSDSSSSSYDTSHDDNET